MAVPSKELPMSDMNQDPIMGDCPDHAERTSSTIGTVSEKKVRWLETFNRILHHIWELPYSSHPQTLHCILARAKFQSPYT